LILAPEKALVIIIFMYAVSFSPLGAQWVLGDLMGITLTSPVTNQVIKPALIGGSTPIINQTAINSFQNNLNSTKSFNVVTAIPTTYAIGWQIFLLLTALYIFNILYLLGVPVIFIIPMIIIYVILLARAVLALVRGY
jgi:hypothetical protein